MARSVVESPEKRSKRIKESDSEEESDANEESSEEESEESEESEEDEDGRSNKKRRTESSIFVNKYQSFVQNIALQRSKALKGEAQEIIKNSMRDLDDMYKALEEEDNLDTKVRFEDARAFSTLAEFAATNVRHLKFNDTGSSLDIDSFLRNIKHYSSFKHEDGNEEGDLENEEQSFSEKYDQMNQFHQFNWLRLGALYYKLSSRAITTDFLYGPLETEKKVRRQERRVNDLPTGKATTAQSVTAQDILSNGDTNTAQMVKNYFEQFVTKAENSAVNFFDCIVNPFSFAQTVENLFFISFLVKDKRLELFEQDDVPYLRIAGKFEKRLAKEGESDSHHIATLDKKTWRGLVETFGITESFFRHRDQIDDSF